MTKDEAISHFGSQAALARALGITQPTICGWGDFPPFERQQQIERVSGGQLKAMGYDEYITWKMARGKEHV